MNDRRLDGAVRAALEARAPVDVPRSLEDRVRAIPGGGAKLPFWAGVGSRTIAAVATAFTIVATVAVGVLVAFGPGMSGAGGPPSPSASPPTACATVALDDRGSVSAFFTSTVGAIRRLSAVNDSQRLAGYASEQAATVCYIDGEIPKGPPPPMSGTIPPSFDRAVIVVVGDDTIFVVAGYRSDLPIESP